MEQYASFFPALVLFNLALLLYRRQQANNDKGTETLALPAESEKGAAAKFKWDYFAPYALVVAADWLQGPFMYTLYKDEKEIPESTVAALFTTGFVSAGISASFVGGMADGSGRKIACLMYCLAYSLSCISVLFNDIAILFAGRVLGGLSTTLQYSVFESWMVTEFHKRELSQSGCLALGDLFSFSVILSNTVAIIAGVAGEGMVRYTGTKTTPFLAAVVCLAVAFVLIYQTWSENYGETRTEKSSATAVEGVTGVRDILADKRILALCLNTTIFEGSMYLFVFFWSPTLIASRTHGGNDSPPPFGLIFSNFMCAMMLGSQIFALHGPQNAWQAARLMLTTLALASWAFLIPVLQKEREMATFWAFALFEACAGLYFPTMSQLKSELVEDGVRAKVYSLMRLPLNAFVVVALGTTREGDEHRGNVFVVVGALMLLAFGVVQRYLL